MKFEVTILGSGSSTPSIRRNPAAQLVNVQENYFLVDCGEGTQLQLRKNKIRFQRIDHIFISHLHGDHYLGLIGYLQSLHLLGRKKEMHIYANEMLEELVAMHMKVSRTALSFPLVFHKLKYDQSETLFENKVVSVSTVILKHRIPCCGFVFREKEKPLKLVPEKLAEYNIPVSRLPGIKEGKDFITDDGEKIHNRELTFEREKSFSYAYCSDTAYSEKLAGQLTDISVLFHESTFTEQHAERAKETFHSTARQAASVAKKIKTKKLILGHFSVRYKSTDDFLKEAAEIFPDTLLAEDGMTFSVYES